MSPLPWKHFYSRTKNPQGMYLDMGPITPFCHESLRLSKISLKALSPASSQGSFKAGIHFGGGLQGAHPMQQKRRVISSGKYIASRFATWCCHFLLAVYFCLTRFASNYCPVFRKLYMCINIKNSE